MYASGLFKLSIALLVFSCIGVIFVIIGLASQSNDESMASKALSLVAYLVQIAVCALGIHSAKTYNMATLIIGAILCGFVVLSDFVLVILWGIAIGAVIAAGTVGGVEVTGVVFAVAVILLVFVVLFFVLYLIEFILFIKHAKIARRGGVSDGEAKHPFTRVVFGTV